MKLQRTFLTLATLAGLVIRAGAVISVGPTGSGTLTFDALPAVTEWSTLSFGTAAGTYTTAAALDAAVNTQVNAASVTTVLGSSPTVPPSQNAIARWNSAGFYLQTRSTANDYLVLMATLRNDTGADASQLTVAYDWDQKNAIPVNESVAGHRVFFSQTGAPGSWTLVPELSTFDNNSAAQALSATLSLGSWPANGLLYIIWVDDNGPGATTNPMEGAYTIDNAAFTVGNVPIPFSVRLTAPANGLNFLAPANVTVSATTGGAVPATSVSFYTNNVLFATIAGAGPYTAQLTALPAGTYTIYAQAVNATETAFSATNTIRGRPEFVIYTSGAINENFDGMGTAGTETPNGWYVSAAPPINGTTVTVGDGSAGAAAAVLGWNYGLTGDPDRALGTAPTGADRNMAVRILNNTRSNIVAFEMLYDGETWRTYTNLLGALTNYVSYDLGVTWIPTTYDYTTVAQSAPGTIGPVNGNDGANRAESIGGMITPPTPITPGGVIYIRWHDFNDAGTDGGVAIDNFYFNPTEFSESVLSLSITSPTNGQSVSAGCSGLANVTVNATASGFVTNVSFTLPGAGTLVDDTRPFSVTFSNVAVGSRTITALARESTAGLTVSTSVTFSVVANPGPAVAFTTVYSGANTGLVFAVGSSITTLFTVSSAATVTNVQFLVNDRVLFTTNVIYGQMIVNDALAGTSVFTVHATDSCGTVGHGSVTVTVTNPPAPVSIIVSNGSSWKYYAAANEPPVDGSSRPWTHKDYDDSVWLSGFAELGGGDAVTPPGCAPERTLVDLGPAGNRFHAVYFRKAFTVANPAAYTNLIVRLLHDDGGAVYLNGTEVFRAWMTNMTTPLTYADFAGTPGGAAQAVAGDGTLYTSSTNPISSANLIAGNNVVAAEIHQESVGSSDISFDLMLWGQEGGGTQPRLHITYDASTGQATITWTGSGQLRSATSLNPPVNWQPVPGNPSSGYTFPVSPAIRQMFYSLW